MTRATTELIRFNIRACGKQGAQPLILLHGFMGNSADWREVVDGFHTERYVLAFDLPGHGGTEVFSDEGYRIDRCGEELMTVLDGYGMGRCNLLGYSMGGRVALHLAVNFPDRFDAVVIESASPGLRTEKEREERRASDAGLIEQLRNRPLSEFVENWYRQPLFASIAHSGEQYSEMINRRLSNDPAKLALSLEHMGAGAQEPLWEKLDRISARTLLLAGEHDMKYRDIMREAKASIPNSEYLQIPKAGHNVHLENPGAFVDAVNKFLST